MKQMAERLGARRAATNRTAELTVQQLADWMEGPTATETVAKTRTAAKREAQMADSLASEYMRQVRLRHNQLAQNSQATLDTHSVPPLQPPRSYF